MFDDDQNNQVVPPSNLPVREADDMFASVDNSASGALAEDDTRPIPDRAPDALSAGVLKPKISTSINPQTTQPFSASAPQNSIDGLNKNNIAQSDLDKQAGSLNQISKYKLKGPVIGKVLFLLIIIIFILAIGLGAWWAYTKLFKNSSTVMTTTSTTAVTKTKAETILTATDTVKVQDSKTDASNTTTQIDNQITSDQILFGEPVDTDGDGLDDIREKQLGTDINKKDTDGDGLTDGDEYYIWKTKPLNKDTDGDSYLDGEEIKYGYSPLGPGKLISIPTTTNKSTSTN